MHHIGANSDQLLRLVEECCGGVATPLYVAPVRHIAGDLVWQGDVHVFRLTDSEQATEAYAWSCPFDGEIHAVPKSGRVPGPTEAVRFVLGASGRASPSVGPTDG
jgi:hypothetical protein